MRGRRDGAFRADELASLPSRRGVARTCAPAAAPRGPGTGGAMSAPELPMSLGGADPLATYTLDLTEAALRGQLEAVRCRDHETGRLITVLMSQSKNNPVLVGDAGVGKTAIVEGLAQRIVRATCPRRSRAQDYSLSHVDLIAGTVFRGQYEKRLKGVIDRASSDPRAILFVDEMHNLIGAGSRWGGRWTRPTCSSRPSTRAGPCGSSGPPRATSSTAGSGPTPR